MKPHSDCRFEAAHSSPTVVPESAPAGARAATTRIVLRLGALVLIAVGISIPEASADYYVIDKHGVVTHSADADPVPDWIHGCALDGDLGASPRGTDTLTRFEMQPFVFVADELSSVTLVVGTDQADVDSISISAINKLKWWVSGIYSRVMVQ